MTVTTINPSAVGAHSGADYSFAHPDPAALAALGINVAQVYGALGSPGKWAPLSEIEADAAAGIGIIIGGEQGTTSWQGGAAVGTVHGTQMRAYLDSIGYPLECPVPFAFDSDVNAGNIATAIDYGNAAFDALGADRVPGVYGDIDIINALKDRSGFNWLTAARSWSGATPAETTIHFVQGGGNPGLGIDYDVVLASFQAWLPGAPMPAAPVVPAPPVVLSIPVPAPPKVAPAPLPTLAFNSSGKHDWRDPYVRIVQTILANKCGHPMPIDANFGRVTERAVRDVQTFMHLHVDGVVGPKETWPALQFIAAQP